LSKYFQPQPKKSNPTIGKIQTLSENYTQEKIATKLIKNYPNAKLLGKNKNNNLVFEINEERISITPKGGIL
jgi:hypothetical protein